MELVDLDMLAFADYVFLADSVDGFQRSVFQLQEMSEEFIMVISPRTTNIMISCGKIPVCSKIYICIYKPIEAVNSFKYLGYYLSYIMD